VPALHALLLVTRYSAHRGLLPECAASTTLNKRGGAFKNRESALKSFNTFNSDKGARARVNDPPWRRPRRASTRSAKPSHHVRPVTPTRARPQAPGGMTTLVRLAWMPGYTCTLPPMTSGGGPRSDVPQCVNPCVTFDLTRSKLTMIECWS